MFDRSVYGIMVWFSVGVCLATEPTPQTPVGVGLDAKGAESNRLETVCSGTCNCSLSEGYAKVMEFRASCEGDGTQNIVVTDALFINESVPGRNQKIYVGISNFSTVQVRDSFLSRWLAYKSCSLDIWYTSTIIFPRHAPPMGQSHVSNHIFAGLGIANSNVSHLPKGLYKNKGKGQLTLTDSNILELNLQQLLSGSSLGNLQINDSSIQTWSGELNASVSLYRRGTFLISGSQISHLHTGAVNFQHGRRSNPVFTVSNSLIGIADTDSMRINALVTRRISNTTIGALMSSAWNLRTGSVLTAERNAFGVFDTSMTTIICGENSHNLSNNVIHIMRQSCDHTDSCQSEQPTLADYLHSSCGGNFLANIVVASDMLVPMAVAWTIPIIVIALLIAVIIWLNIFRGEHFASSSGLYEEPTYFAPLTAAPMHSTFDDYVEPRTRRVSQALSYGKPVSLVMHPDDLYDMDEYVIRM